MGAAWAEIIFGVMLIICAIVFSCGGCFVCCFGKDAACESSIPAPVQVAQPAVPADAAQPVYPNTAKEGQL